MSMCSIDYECNLLFELMCLNVLYIVHLPFSPLKNFLRQSKVFPHLFGNMAHGAQIWNFAAFCSKFGIANNIMLEFV